MLRSELWMPLVCNSPWCWCALVQNAVHTRLRLRILDRSSIIRSTRIKEDPSSWDSDGICRSRMDPKVKGAVTLLLFRKIGWILLNVRTMPKILHYLIKVFTLLSNVRFSALFWCLEESTDRKRSFHTTYVFWKKITHLSFQRLGFSDVI